MIAMTFQLPSPGDTTVADTSIHNMTYEDLKLLPILHIGTPLDDVLELLSA